MEFSTMMVFLSLVLPFFALAAPSPELVRIVRGSLHPGISVSLPRGPAGDCGALYVDILGRDPVTNQPRHVHATVYTPERGFRGTVLELPPTGGKNPLDQGYAHSLCNRGLRAAILESFDFDESFSPDFAGYDRTALRTLAAAEHLLEYLKPSGKVGILGTSLGAIQAAFVLGYDARITTAAFVAGGDGLPEILANSDEHRVRRVREQQMQEHGFRTVDEYRHALERAIHIEPSTFADFSGHKDVQFYVATRDTTVPTDNQHKLVEAFHGRDVTEVDGNHVEAVLRTYMQYSGRIVSFFAEKL